jgi:hypothetical protein
MKSIRTSLSYKDIVKVTISGHLMDSLILGFSSSSNTSKQKQTRKGKALGRSVSFAAQ